MYCNANEQWMEQLNFLPFINFWSDKTKLLDSPSAKYVVDLCH